MAKVQFVALFAIILGSVAGFLDPLCSNRDRPPFLAPGDSNGMRYTARFSGFGVVFSACLFSQLFQHRVPGLLQPLREHPETCQPCRCVGRPSYLPSFPSALTCSRSCPYRSPSSCVLQQIMCATLAMT